MLRSHGQGERIFCAQIPPNPNPDGGGGRGWMTQIMEEKGLIGPNPTFDFPHTTQSLDYRLKKIYLNLKFLALISGNKDKWKRQ